MASNLFQITPEQLILFMNYFQSHKSGLTLVELLVAISVLTIVTALIIPRVRLVNKDRNIRETARVIGSAFTAARERAISDGRAGLIIRRNTNFVATTADNNVNYAGTRLFQMRQVPTYSGDGSGAAGQCTTREFNNTIQVLIPDPSVQDTVRVNDYIRIDNRLPRYRITNIDDAVGGQRPLTLEWDNRPPGNPGNIIFETEDTRDFRTSNPAPPISDPGPPVETFSFEVLRQPVALETSSVDLPAGYIIDLRYSGPLDGEIMPGDGGLDGDTETHSLFGQANETDDIVIWFGPSGGIDRVIAAGEVRFPQALFFYVTEFDPEIPNNNTQVAADSLLTIAENLWLTVDVNGGVNIAYNAPPAPGDDVQTMISNARTLSRNRTSANQ